MSMERELCSNFDIFASVSIVPAKSIKPRRRIRDTFVRAWNIYLRTTLYDEWAQNNSRGATTTTIYISTADNTSITSHTEHAKTAAVWTLWIREEFLHILSIDTIGLEAVVSVSLCFSLALRFPWSDIYNTQPLRTDETRQFLIAFAGTKFAEANYQFETRTTTNIYIEQLVLI